MLMANDDTFAAKNSQGLSANWRTIFQNLQQLGPAELASRKQGIQRFLKENGVTYNIYHNAGEATRIWNLNPIPYLIEQTEWQKIESGLQQRANLLNLILADLYGSQQLLKEKILPHELV